MPIAKLPRGTRLPVSKRELEFLKENPKIAEKLERCILKIEEKNLKKGCTRRDIKLRQKGCVNPYAVCRFSVLGGYKDMI